MKVNIPVGVGVSSVLTGKLPLYSGGGDLVMLTGTHALQVKTSVLKSGKKMESDIVIVGVGARPNTEMFKGQIDFLEDRPGGIKVRSPF